MCKQSASYLAKHSKLGSKNVKKNLPKNYSKSTKITITACTFSQFFRGSMFPNPPRAFLVSQSASNPCNNAKTFLDALDEKMQNLNQRRTKTVMMGNINLDLTLTKATFLVSDYLDIIRSNAFSNLIDKPTRVTPNTQTIIDHVLTNNSETKFLVYQTSDHYATSCVISSDKPLHDETNLNFLLSQI